MRRHGLIVAALILASAPGLAQAAPATGAKVDAATLAAARDLMAASDMREGMRALYPRMADAMGAQMRQMFVENEVPAGLSVELTAAIQANIASMDDVFSPAFLDELALIYARHFSTEELTRIASLMRDPAMQKFRAETPAVMTEMMPMIFEALKPRQEQFQQRLRQIVADWIRAHPEDEAKLRSPVAS